MKVITLIMFFTILVLSTLVAIERVSRPTEKKVVIETRRDRRRLR